MLYGSQAAKIIDNMEIKNQNYNPVITQLQNDLSTTGQQLIRHNYIKQEM